MARSPDVLNIREAASFLGAHEQTVRRLARRDAIPCFKVGRDWRFHTEALRRWTEEQRVSGRRSYVLVIDDDEKLCKALVRIIEKLGFRACKATSGEVGLELVAREAPGLILLDLVMPGMDGPLFLAKLRQAHPTLPVAIVTGYPDSDLMKEAMLFAPILLLPKPVDEDLLDRTMRSVIGDREPSPEIVPTARTSVGSNQSGTET